MAWQYKCNENVASRSPELGSIFSRMKVTHLRQYWKNSFPQRCVVWILHFRNLWRLNHWIYIQQWDRCLMSQEKHKQARKWVWNWEQVNHDFIQLIRNLRGRSKIGWVLQLNKGDFPILPLSSVNMVSPTVVDNKRIDGYEQWNRQDD